MMHSLLRIIRRLSSLQPTHKTMTDHSTDHTSIHASTTTDTLRSAVLLAGTQVMIALLGAVLLTNGLVG